MHIFNPYPGRSGVELDLRKELNDTLMGGNMEIPKGQLVILRIMRRDANAPAVPTKEEHLTLCECVDAFTLEADKTYPCKVCDGERYLFDEFWATAYSEERYETVEVEEYRQYAKQTTALKFFYVEFYQPINRFDVLIEVQTDVEGNVQSPVQVLKRHAIHHAQPMRSDEGRVEFWRLSTFSE